MSTIEFSYASEENYAEILELNKSLVPTWFKYDRTGKRGEDTTWGVLSTRERYLHGGPWLSSDTLKIHFQSFTKYGEVLLMWMEGELIGEVEFHQIKDPISYVNTENCVAYHIDWIMIRSDYQAKGFGSKILQYLDVELRNRNKENIYIITEPDLGIDEFYMKNGFFDQLPEISVYSCTGEVASSDWIYEFPGIEKYVYGNYDVSKEFSLFQLETEIEYAKLFNVKHPISYLQLDDNVKAIRQKISAFSNKYKMIITSIESLSEEEVGDYLDELVTVTHSYDVLVVSLPYKFTNEKWSYKYSVPKLIKRL